MNYRWAVRLTLAAALAVGLTGAVAAPAVAATVSGNLAAAAMAPPKDNWERLWDFNNKDLCEAVGHAGEAVGVWENDEWYCDNDGTLYVDR